MALWGRYLAQQSSRSIGHSCPISEWLGASPGSTSMYSFLVTWVREATSVIRVLEPVTHVGDLHWVPGPCLQHGPPLALICISGVNHNIRFSLFLSHSLFFKQKWKHLKTTCIPLPIVVGQWIIFIFNSLEHIDPVFNLRQMQFLDFQFSCLINYDTKLLLRRLLKNLPMFLGLLQVFI